jgi:hypothetical protein
MNGFPIAEVQPFRMGCVNRIENIDGGNCGKYEKTLSFKN